MGQILRFAHGRIRVPKDLPEACTWYVDSWWDSLTETMLDEHVGAEEAAAIRGLHAVHANGSGWVRVDGEALSYVRNLADADTLNVGSECESYAEDEAVQLNENGECLCCNWCQALVLRDRIDYWFDQNGIGRSPYIGTITYDVEAEWRKVWGGGIAA